MSKPVVTVEMDDTLQTANDIFSHTHFHHLLVVDKGVLVGVISDRDVLKALSPNIDTAAEKPTDRATLNKRAHQIMSRHPITLKAKDRIKRVVEIFDDNRISCIPIVDENHKPVGIVSWRDIIKTIRARYQ
ncbi:CBS domain-containing protein [Psychrosphaera ytuae]|uniref:CBS domain-containing protein n=2 Tax=Psychrosphaera ytuae TaxID=2820710 RepID=A0A975HJG2_9GAMM|nr:CBS domain-containing protein [Psychrosphaera ytuae]